MMRKAAIAIVRAARNRRRHPARRVPVASEDGADDTLAGAGWSRGPRRKAAIAIVVLLVTGAGILRGVSPSLPKTVRTTRESKRKGAAEG